MPGIGSLISAAVQGAVSALLGPILQIFRDRSLKQQGAADQRAADQASELEKKDAQLRVAANHPDTIGDVSDKLRNGDF